MKHYLDYCLLIAAFLPFNSSLAQALKSVKIDRGIIKDDFTITVVSKYLRNKQHLEMQLPAQIIIEPNKFFSLEQLGLESCYPRTFSFKPKSGVMNLAGYDRFYKPVVGAGGKAEVIYNIRINKKGKLYYGKMLLYGAIKLGENKAVTSYYQISIPEHYFEDAKAGRVSYTYEYWQSPEDTQDPDNFLPTWVIWLSDSPF